MVGEGKEPGLDMDKLHGMGGKGPEPDKEKLQGLRGNRTRNGQGKGLKLQKVGGEKEH